MTSTDTLMKIDMLKEKGFKYNFNRDIYINPMSKKLFSLEAIEDHDEEWIQGCLNESNDEWKFYCNEQPSDFIKEVLLKEII